MVERGYKSEAIAELYDHVVPYAARSDVEFYVKAAREVGPPVLELGCGTGRILIPTARAGVDIVGLDSAETMLGKCRKRLESEPEEVRSRVRLLHGQMQDFDLDTKFRLITTPFRPFQHLLTVEDQIACLRQVHAHLHEGGIFILDVFNPSIEMLAARNIGAEIDEEPEFVLPDGRRVIRQHRTVSRDLFNQINDEELVYYLTYPDGTQETLVDAIRMRYLYRFEAEHLLGRCGFRLLDVWADYDKSPYGSTYPGELVLVAQRE